MKTLLILILSCLIFTSCTTMRDPKAVRDSYENQIKDWQERVKKEGWTNRVIKSINMELMEMSVYVFDKEIPGQKWPGDHWDTPNEFFEKGLVGDCEDMAVLAWSTFKRLNYPYQIRIQAVTMLTGDHAIVSIELADGSWMMLESVLANYASIESLFYRSFAEWDVNNIYTIGK